MPPEATPEGDALRPVSAWECADCGWSIEAQQLQPGSSLDQARDAHTETYCASPPMWP